MQFVRNRNARTLRRHPSKDTPSASRFERAARRRLPVSWLAAAGHGLRWVGSWLVSLSMGGCSYYQVVVPQDRLRTWTIQSEPVQVITANPFSEHIELKSATLSYPYLGGTVVSIQAPWAGELLGKPLSLGLTGKFNVSQIAERPPIGLDPRPSTQTGTRVLIQYPWPLPTKVELRDAKLQPPVLTGVLHAMDRSWADEQVGHAIVLDVRTLTQLSVRRTESQVGRVLGGIGIGVGVVAGILLTATAVVVIVAAAQSIPSFVPK